ncbi:hypothetical protein PM8797T_01119 [Gimesia maris DSM 8797]|nr:hypothetical protein PM8797T_01119 [Gimesia maris DSM 8797]
MCELRAPVACGNTGLHPIPPGAEYFQFSARLLIPDYNRFWYHGVDYT